jgi:hypothetical protein
VEVANSPLPQYHVSSNVFYVAILEFKRLSKTPEWVIKREREDACLLFGEDKHGAPLELFEELRIKLFTNKARLVTVSPSSLPSRVKNILTNAMTLLDFTFHDCSWFLKGNFNFCSIVMGCMDEYYAAANSHAEEMTNVMWMSCIQGIGIARTVLIEFLALSHGERIHVFEKCHFLFSTLRNLGISKWKRKGGGSTKRYFLTH